MNDTNVLATLPSFRNVQDKNLSKEYSAIAKMPVIAENGLDDEQIGFGEELAVLRLYKHFNGNGSVGEVKSLGVWYFRFGK
jgi:hypothetical protein